MITVCSGSRSGTYGRWHMSYSINRSSPSWRVFLLTPIAALSGLLFLVVYSMPDAQADEILDAQVQALLESDARQWRDQNVPAADGRILHDLIVERGFTRAVEIGTSTGHSTTWIAWALSKTGGKLVTFEINRSRYEEAKQNIAAAGLSDYVEFVLGDAHEAIPALNGPYDFVFSDADKDWYINYFDALYPKLTADACSPLITSPSAVYKEASGVGGAMRQITTITFYKLRIWRLTSIRVARAVSRSAASGDDMAYLTTVFQFWKAGLKQLNSGFWCGPVRNPFVCS